MGLIVHWSYINDFFKKILVWDKQTLWNPEWRILPSNSGSVVRIFLQFCTMKGTKKGMEIILMVFLKEILFRAVWSFVQKMVWCPQNFGYAVFLHFFIFIILHNNRDQEVHENFISCFLRKNLSWVNLIFLGHLLNTWLGVEKLSQATVTIGSLKSQGMISFIIATGSLNRQDTIKACVRYFLSNFYFSPNDSPSKTMKNVFYFI